MFILLKRSKGLKIILPQNVNRDVLLDPFREGILSPGFTPGVIHRISLRDKK
jgi:hypothetical protein